MKTSKVVSAVLALALVGGGVTALARGGNAIAATSVCTSAMLSMADQNECKSQMKTAPNAKAREQVTAYYQGKIDTQAPPASATPRSDADTSGAVATPNGSTETDRTMTPAVPPTTTTQTPQ